MPDQSNKPVTYMELRAAYAQAQRRVRQAVYEHGRSSAECRQQTQEAAEILRQLRQLELTIIHFKP